MDMSIEIGIKGSSSALVEKEDTAQIVGSGDLLVYATPCMVALMEGAACESIAPFLAEGESSVGTMMNVVHTSATPVGMEVRAESLVTAVDGRKVCFEIVAYDEVGEIGRATHERFIIKADRFLEKTYDKL
ncbi:MAG: dihydrolipoamide acyltransferase [Ruminococcaceae bacterium]|nr:dihydrolipoamide acyltransferase [Oscillospiraceae bacterium]